MKIRIIKGNLLNQVEREVNKFIETVKVEDIKISTNEKNYVVMILYYDLV